MRRIVAPGRVERVTGGPVFPELLALPDLSIPTETKSESAEASCVATENGLPQQDGVEEENIESIANTQSIHGDSTHHSCQSSIR